jgi:hypothetical protein
VAFKGVSIGYAAVEVKFCLITNGCNSCFLSRLFLENIPNTHVCISIQHDLNASKVYYDAENQQ